MNILDELEKKLEDAERMIAKALVDLRSITPSELAEIAKIGSTRTDPQYRCSIDGDYVSKAHADENPLTTQSETATKYAATRVRAGGK